ncbi:DUF6377 domain-containing protein [Parabacteroides sp. PF5-9]|uniref:DUF6377 domain-containing protein n=1 Tax=Parabacteroides sp. PF5-9 TaxID=1742404 RepID=UPI0024738DF7|nr:DUF6377 domain-containing protein [Parabacteroides sp. PF5-9]MDH6357570.1 uncharacterized protein YoxC [Parabacteroides sp. PF5-9]
MKLNTGIFSGVGCLILLICVVYTPAWGNNDIKALSNYLDHLMVNKQQLALQKEQRINKLKDMLSLSDFSLEQKYEINRKLYEEYKTYKLDSAVCFAERNLQIAGLLEIDSLAYISCIQLATMYSCSGLFRESENILKSLNSAELPKGLLPDYYYAYCLFFERYGAAYNLPGYAQQKEEYRDSLLNTLPTSVYTYKINKARQCITYKQAEQAEKILLNLLEEAAVDSHDYAFITYYLGAVYRIMQNKQLEKKYFLLSAIADIKGGIKENASFQELALVYYEAGDIAKAFQYTQSAIEDAVFCNVQFRTMQLSEFYSIINASHQAKETYAKRQLRLYLGLVCILSVFLVILVVYIYQQMKKLAKMREVLLQTNDKLLQLNEDLNNTNHLLSEKNILLQEANHIKEQYIAQFFDLCSNYINKMEENRRSLHKLAINKQLEQLIKKLKSTTEVDGEYDDLYRHFDTVFLSLYPTFIADFNALLLKEERIKLKSKNFLNKELRIYALLRLGITDSEKIASFLRCSLSTVYNYRTKIRNKASISRDTFEERVMKIGILHQKKK